MENSNICKIMVDPAQLQHELFLAFDDVSSTNLCFNQTILLLDCLDHKICEFEELAKYENPLASEIDKRGNELTMFTSLIRDQIFEIKKGIELSTKKMETLKDSLKVNKDSLTSNFALSEKPPIKA